MIKHVEPPPPPPLCDMSPLHSPVESAGDKVGMSGDPPGNLLHMLIRGHCQLTTESNKVTVKTDKHGRGGRLLETGAGNSGHAGAEQPAYNWCGPGISTV